MLTRALSDSPARTFRTSRTRRRGAGAAGWRQRSGGCRRHWKTCRQVTSRDIRRRARASCQARPGVGPGPGADSHQQTVP